VIFSDIIQFKPDISKIKYNNKPNIIINQINQIKKIKYIIFVEKTNIKKILFIIYTLLVFIFLKSK
jgi:hypothetical protein